MGYSYMNQELCWAEPALALKHMSVVVYNK